MSYPKISDLATAFTLCACPSVGDCEHCTVCKHESWRDGPCVRELFWQRWDSATQRLAAKELRHGVALTVDGPRYLGILKDVVAAEENCYEATFQAIPDPDGSPYVSIEQPTETLGDRAVRFVEEGLGYKLQPWQRHILKQMMDYRDGSVQ